MAYTAPTTRTTGTLITASIWNTDMVDNISYLYSNLKLVQVVNTQTSSSSTTSTVIPYDSSIPQNTEGGEFMTLAITPTNTANKLIIHSMAYMSHSSTSNKHVSALFQDTTANAIAVAYARQNEAGEISQVKLEHYMTAGTTSSTTFKIRCGSNSTGTLTFNTTNYGGLVYSHITIYEIKT